MTDIVKRLRVEDPECGLRHSLAMEAADCIEALERELAEERRSREEAQEFAWKFSDALREIAAQPNDNALRPNFRIAMAALGQWQWPSVLTEGKDAN